MKRYVLLSLLYFALTSNLSLAVIPAICVERYEATGAIPGTSDCPFLAAGAPVGTGSYFCTGNSGLTTYIPAYCGDVDEDDCSGSNSSTILGNPINVATGHKLEVAIDYRESVHSNINFPLVHKRYYNSNYRIPGGSFGPTWRGTYDRSIQFVDANKLKLIRHSGGMITFNKTGQVWQSTGHADKKLIEVKDNQGATIGWRLVLSDKTVEDYDVNGVLQSISNRYGLTHRLEYQNARLYRVYDDSNRFFEFKYNEHNVVSELINPDGTSIRFTYEEFELGSVNRIRLSKVVTPDKTPGNANDNPFLQYLYDEELYVTSNRGGYYLTGIVDENGDRYATFGYDHVGRANLSVHGTHDEDTTEGDKDNADRINVIYNLSGDTFSATSINAKGKQTSYSFQKFGQKRRPTAINGLASPNCQAAASGYTYDSNGFPGSVTDWNGNLTNYTFSAEGLERSRIEAKGQGVERTIETDWYVEERLPKEIRKEGLTINFTYENGRIKTRTETDTTNFTVPYATNGRQRQWVYTYTYHDPENKKVASVSVDGPRTDVSDVTTYEYNDKGWLTKVINAKGHETTILEHNLRGQPLRIQDANGIETVMTYHPRGWLETRSVHSQHGVLTSVFDYDDAGLVTKITTPDGKVLDLDYDTAHRLVKITNNLGEELKFTLDEFGNPTVTEARDSANKIQQLVRKEFDELGRLWKIIAPEGHDQEVMRYDSNSNLVRAYDANGVPRIQAFDGLDRLDVVTDREGGIIDYSYDERDKLIKVSDKNQLETIYTVDGFGFRIQEQSPDRGTIIYRYDSAGNLREKQDARNVITQYTYDALNRVETQSIVGMPAEAITYIYDETGTEEAPNFGIGKLTGIEQAIGDSEAYIFDDRGNKIKRTATINGQTYITEFGYNTKNQLERITYPSGRLVYYGYDSLGRINLVSTQENEQSETEIIVEDVSYKPFGPLATLTYGNGLALTKTYDRHYRVDTITSATSSNVMLSLDYGYDTRGNIDTIDDLLDASRSQSFTSDAISRLVNASGIYGDFGYQYDSNGNREQVTWSQGSVNYTETYTTETNTSNRLLQIDRTGFGASVKGFDYSDSGNTTQSGNFSFVYDGRDRLVQVLDGTTLVADYRHNALHQRTAKFIAADNSQNKHFHYDLSGTLLAENHPSGTDVKDYIYLEGMLLAIVDDQDDTVLNQTDISVTLVGDDGKFKPDKDRGDGTVAFIAAVSNTNPAVAAHNVSLAITYPEGVTLDSITPSVGNCDSSGKNCLLGTLAPNATASIRVVVRQPKKKKRDYAVQASTSTEEPNLQNNTANGSYGGAIQWLFLVAAAMLGFIKRYKGSVRAFIANQVLMKFTTKQAQQYAVPLQGFRTLLTGLALYGFLLAPTQAWAATYYVVNDHLNTPKMMTNKA